MPRPRRSLISLEDTPYYHCCSRVVRKAYLCGNDNHTGKNYDHRRGWIESQLLKLTDIFAIDVAAFSVMTNHLHVVLFIDVNQANAWSDREVIKQWHRLFNGTTITQQFVKGEVIEAHQVTQLKHQIATYRSRLSDISWFMRCLNEPIARQANREDDCTGHFWEGRFKSQALLDEAALLACMAYVELNPIRAKIASTPENSEHTSLKLRIKAALVGKQPEHLLPFLGNERKNQSKGITFELKSYLELVDETGRLILNNKQGAIAQSAMPILNRLNILEENWIKIVDEFGRLFHGPIGTLEALTTYSEHLNKRRRHFSNSCRLF
ncbi:transposase [uncultured Shewanella sp.]|uniref:transposase n=1 Tax=uncultured Shewanella sp. TaxID=173975 RepID=UPI0026395909|nr:transposase [uncultured Shewanella sp.]